MTPTLLGRWQTRLVMVLTLGVLVTVAVASLRDGPFFHVLGYTLGFGLAWDVLYIQLQRLRWDRDWPAAFQVASGLVEGLLIYGLIRHVGLPGIPAGSVPVMTFTAHYGLMWLVIFIWVQGPMRAVLPRWRFDGGRVL